LFGFFGKMMQLTRRQTTFVERLVDLYHEAEGPIHYSTLARRVGVNRFTAYDMLRLLEEKGLVTSAYQLTAGRSGPGRSEVLYQPTERARALVAQLAGPTGQEDWDTIKRRLVDNFAGAHARDRELTEAMLARVPRQAPAPVRYCLEVMTVVALRLKGRARRAALARALPALLRSPDGGDRASLGLLGGWALSALASEARADEVWHREVLAHLRRFQALVMEMDPRLCRRLSDGLWEVFAPLVEEAGSAPRQALRVREPER
jgi:DNA-binding PadR family transcriptional regulator